MFIETQGYHYMDTAPLSVYYLRVTLKDSKPEIWRDILVPSNLTLEELHYVIQTAMGWDNCHSHQFIAGEVLYSDAIDHTGQYNSNADDEIDRNERKYTVLQVLPEEKNSLIYEYDLADGWTHIIELKKILPADADARQPRCVQGEQACPPEDCGGVWGYTDMLETLKNAENTGEYAMLTGFGEDFNPDHFDIDAVNRVLKNLLFNTNSSLD